MLAAARRAGLWALDLAATWFACVLGLCLSWPAWLALQRNTPKSFARHFPFPAVRKAVVSVVIPCYNEKATIRQVLKRLDDTAVERDSVELIVADAASPDGTASEAKRAGTRCAKRVVTTSAGRAQAHNEGAAEARGDIVFFLHADTKVPLGWDKLIRDCLRDPTVVLGSFSFGVDRSSFKSDNRWGGCPTGMGIVESFANFRSSRFQLPYGDQGIFLLRQRWAQLGPMPSLVMMEDFEFVRRARTQAIAEGRRIAVLPQVALCSGRRWEALGVPVTTLSNQWFVFAYTALGFTDRQIYKLYYGVEAPEAAATPTAASDAAAHDGGAQADAPAAAGSAGSPSRLSPLRVQPDLASKASRQSSPVGPMRFPAALTAPSPAPAAVSPSASGSSPLGPARFPSSLRVPAPGTPRQSEPVAQLGSHATTMTNDASEGQGAPQGAGRQAEDASPTSGPQQEDAPAGGSSPREGGRRGEDVGSAPAPATAAAAAEVEDSAEAEVGDVVEAARPAEDGSQPEEGAEADGADDEDGDAAAGDGEIATAPAPSCDAAGAGADSGSGEVAGSAEPNGANGGDSKPAQPKGKAPRQKGRKHGKRR